jgi:DNA helicase-2/ATP-dependent DNA helicase PcrA
MNADNTTVIYGAPGTGKTARLMQLLSHVVEAGVETKRIGYFSFTKRASEVARQRAFESLRLDNRKALVNFQTLHALAFRITGANKEAIVSEEDLHDFANQLGYQAPPRDSFKTFTQLGRPCWNRAKAEQNALTQMLFVIDAARIKGTSYDEERSQLSRRDFTLDQCLDVARLYNEYKEDCFLSDYTDLLEEACQYIDDPRFPELDVIFVDEAQDLSYIQWKFLSCLASRAKKVYVAGDDDQAIYRWAGADVDRFIDLPGKIEVLPQSHRVPVNIQKIAQYLIEPVSKRQPKEWQPKPSEDGGHVERIAQFQSVDMSQGEWLVLARNASSLAEAEEYCYTKGYAFWTSRSKYDVVNNADIKALHNWQRLYEHATLSAEEAATIVKKLRPEVVGSVEAELTGEYDYKRFRKELRLAQTNLPEELFQIKSPLVSYYHALRDTGDVNLPQARIRISTIHQMKGAESQNVIVHTDMSRATHANMSRTIGRDDEHRVFYVAATRAKQALYVMTPRRDHPFMRLHTAIENVRGEK